MYITGDDGVTRKFACQTCIKVHCYPSHLFTSGELIVDWDNKGHRSTKCTHSDRKLVEIKRKGRPVTQCAECRHLRKTKQMHVKCICNPKRKGTVMIKTRMARFVHGLAKDNMSLQSSTSIRYRLQHQQRYQQQEHLRRCSLKRIATCELSR